ncbi:hypothetical protein JCM9279_003039 [Rhodotorula babjevae]
MPPPHPRPPPDHTDSDSDYDPVAFQADLDHSVSETRSLVQSWIPPHLGTDWSDGGFAAKQGQDGLQSLKDRARPPRLGLGAQPASLHKQLAEDRKIASRLLRGRNLALGDEGSNVATASSAPVAGGEDGEQSSSSDDDDESRSRAVGKGKARASAASTNPFVLPSTTNKPKTNGTPAKATRPLFNDPSPAKPSPSTSTSTGSLMTPVASSSSFYTPPSTTSSTAAAAAATSTTNGAAGLTKNQRKKERERLKREDERRRREEESRAAALEEEGGAVGSDDKQGRKRARGEDGEAPTGEDEVDGEVDEDVARSRTASPAKAGGAVGEGGEASPKKRRKKKKRKGGEGAGAGAGAAGPEGAGAPPLLNLAPLVGAGGA